MFYINKETELTIELLQKMINRFRVNVEPKLNRYKNYYDGIQSILNKTYSDPSKPCNKSVINYCKNIVDSYCGYLATPSYISYRSEQDITDVMEILKYNDYQAEDADFLFDALIYGTAAELMYNDAEGHTRFRLINPTQCFAVYDDSLTEDLLYFVRMYRVNEWDNSDTYAVDVYSDYDIKHYTMQGTNGYLSFKDEEPHYFAQCPANVFNLPDEKSIFDCIMSLQDSVNELLSAEIDDFSAFCDAYLVLSGCDLEAEDVASMKENRVLVLPEGAVAGWLTKNASDAQVENILKRIHDSIYRIAQCPDFSSETFVGGVSSGIAIRYRLTGMETRAAKICAEMKKALQRRVEIICGIATLKLGEEVYREIEIDFKRNIPEDLTAVINVVNSLKGTVSDATLLGQLPFISDINAELEAVQAQKSANMELYGFNAPVEETEEEEI
ncbi:MAG: phage portal protein [Ruminococcaceae bacterium]|nr:phage portal protein [Oscillospiraceae bacterium]